MRKLSIALAATVFFVCHFPANAALPTAEHLQQQLLDSKVLPSDQPVNTRTQGSTAFVSTLKKTTTKDAEAGCRIDAFNVAKTILELNQTIAFVVVDFFDTEHHFYRRATIDRLFLKKYMGRKKDSTALIRALKLEKPSRMSKKELETNPFAALTRSRYGDLPASARPAKDHSNRSADSSTAPKKDPFNTLMNSRHTD